MSKAKASKAEPSFQDALLAKLKAGLPKSDEWGVCEISRSNDEVLSAIRYVLTTGIKSFDDIVGGMPFGRIVELYGLESCGKTAMAIRSAVRAQMKAISEVSRKPDGTLEYHTLDPDDIEVAVLYIDNEQSLDDDDKLVVDGVKLNVITMRCDTIDMVFKMADRMIEGAEESTSKKTQFVVIVVDTIASTSARQDINQPWGKVDFPRLPGEISKGFSKLVRRVNSSNVCMICTNQVRTKFGAATGPGGGNGVHSYQYSSLGGMALRFYASHRVFMHALGSKYKLAPNAQFAAGIQIGFQTAKNRLRMPQREGRMVLLFDQKQGGFNDAFSKLETLIYLDFIEVGSKEKGTDFTVNFASHGVETTTFDVKDVEASLEEEDDAPAPVRGRRLGKRKKNPGFKLRAEWPAFYAAHKADVDQLWGKAIEYAFSTEGLNGVLEDEVPVEPVVFGEGD